MTRTAAASPAGPAAWSACPLCGSAAVSGFARVHGRSYGECPRCRLIHLAPEQRPGSPVERAEYATHRNDPADAGYRAFLSRLSEPLVGRLPAGAEGLDYGSGPGPALSVMLQAQGFRMRLYDPFFAPDATALDRRYDFITCTETVEHFFRPGEEFERLNRMLRPGGWLGVMTQIFTGAPPFEQWRYARERTHVCFYRARTIAWLAERFGWSAEAPARNVVLFRKPAVARVTRDP